LKWREGKKKLSPTDRLTSNALLGGRGEWGIEIKEEVFVTVRGSINLVGRRKDLRANLTIQFWGGALGISTVQRKVPYDRIKTTQGSPILAGRARMLGNSPKGPSVTAEGPQLTGLLRSHAVRIRKNRRMEGGGNIIGGEIWATM